MKWGLEVISLSPEHKRNKTNKQTKSLTRCSKRPFADLPSRAKEEWLLERGWGWEMQELSETMGFMG